MKKQNSTPDKQENSASSGSFFGQRAKLEPKDLIVFENRLKDLIAKFISFKGYSLYFPTGKMKPMPKWLPEEKKLLIPLIHGGEPLGVFAASDVSMKNGQLDSLNEVTGLCLENLLLFKKSLLDPASGLYTRQHLLEYMAEAIEEIQNSMVFGPALDGKFNLPAAPACSMGGSFSVLVANFSPLSKVGREYGFAFADKFTTALAGAFKEVLPEQALAASVGDTAFAVYLPNRVYSDCVRIGRELCAKMSQLELPEPLSGVKVSLPVAVGFACYPLDLEAGFSRPAPLEQGIQILRRARLASSRAWDAPRRQKHGREGAQNAPEPNLLGFSEIIMQGGKVLDILPMARVETNLGLGVGAREGMHFRVFSPEPGGTPQKIVGEIALSNVQESGSQGEIIHLSNPTRSITAGDRLELLPDLSLDEVIVNREDSSGAETLPKTALLSHRAFLASFAAERESTGRFALALMRLLPGEAINPDASDAVSEADILTRAVGLVLEELAQLMEKGAFTARYGLHSLIFYLPNENTANLEQTFKNIIEKLEKDTGIDAACGIAEYPFLDYRKSDSLGNAGKALDYAMLLPKPKVGRINSLALNIRADCYFSQGDMFAAINEYKQALLADDSNAWAWTSLGVCFAGIGNREESRRSFEMALSKEPDDIMALYNLAQVLQAEGETPEAKEYYERCLKLSPEHVFSLLRLGQMAENTGDYEKAEEYFQKAGELPQGEGAASRHLARIALARKNPDEAREHLHRALTRNPDDALALGMLAEIYLNAGDNPEIALSLARQSVALRPDYSLGWLGLARAYESCNEPEQAQRARLRAAEI